MGKENKEILEGGVHWKRILYEIYLSAPGMWGYSNKMHYSYDDHPLAKQLEIKGHDLMLGVAFLEDNKLIKTQTNTSNDGTFSAQWILTNRGFDVALNNEHHFHQTKILKSQEISNKYLAQATTVLAIAAFLQILFYVISKDFSLGFTTITGALSTVALLVFGIWLIGIMVKLIILILFPKSQKNIRLNQ